MPDHPLYALLQSGLDQLQLQLSAGQMQQCLDYLDLLARWNKAYNLTAVRQPDAMVGLHLLDSLSVLTHLPEVECLADMGAGAGLPGIPLAIALPQQKFHLIDSNGKKSAFQRQAVLEINLANVAITNARVENLGDNLAFDAVISRAFTSLRQMVAWAAAVLAPGGLLLAMKGVYPTDELADLPTDVEVCQVDALHVPGVNAERHLVQLRLPRTKV